MARLTPIHPGEILRQEFMVSLTLNANMLALTLHVPAPAVYEIAREERGISLEMGLRLGRAFRTTPDFWMNLQADYELRMAREEKEAMINNKVQPLELRHT